MQPRLEEWVIAGAKVAQIDMEDFGLSERGNDFHREINSRLSAFSRLIETLLAKASPRVVRLQKLLAG